LKSFVFRTMTLNEFGVRPKVEISIPIFFRSKIQEILGIGKSVKIVRFLDKQQDPG
jgi:hypothetical protein